MTRQKGFNKTRFEAKARLIDTVRVFSLYTHLIAMIFDVCFETHSFCNCCFNYATKSKSCHHHTNFLIHTSSTCRVEKKRVQSFEIIIFVDTLISFVFKLDKRHLNGQKENAIVILYTLQVLKTNKIELKHHNKLDEVIKRDCAFLFSFLIYFFCLLTKRLLTRRLSNIYKSIVNHFLRLHFSFSSFTWLFPPEIAMTWYDHTFFHLRHCLLLHGNKH